MWTTPELALKGMNGLYETFYNRKQSNGTQVRSENLDGLNTAMPAPGLDQNRGQRKTL